MSQRRVKIMKKAINRKRVLAFLEGLGIDETTNLLLLISNSLHIKMKAVILMRRVSNMLVKKSKKFPQFIE